MEKKTLDKIFELKENAKKVSKQVDDLVTAVIEELILGILKSREEEPHSRYTSDIHLFYAINSKYGNFTYPDINQALQNLCESDKIAEVFEISEGHPFLGYRLK